MHVATSVVLVFLPIVMWPPQVLCQAIGLAYPLKDCQDFPFFDQQKWREYASNANLTTKLKESGHNGRWGEPTSHSYSLKVNLPSLVDYVGLDADRCFEKKGPYGPGLSFELAVRLEGPNNLSVVAEFECKYYHTLRYGELTLHG